MHPFFIWGDDCQYNESYEKLIVICMGHVLDRRTFSLESSWPIIVLREVSSSHLIQNRSFFSFNMILKEKIYFVLYFIEIT